MPITAEQRAARVKCIGSSDMASILGVNPWRSAYDLWLDKKGLVEREPDDESRRLGTALENAALDEAELRLGSLDRNVFAELPEIHLGANVDAILRASGEPVEAKTSGIAGPLYGQWGEEGTDQVPDMYVIQAHVHMMCTKKEVCHLLALLGGLGARLYRINLQADIRTIIEQAAVGFWKSVDSDTPPEDSKPSLEVLKRVRRTTDRIAHVDPMLVAEYQGACAAVKEAETKKDQAQAALLAADPAAEAFDFGDAKKWYSFFSQQRTNVDSKALQADHPDIWAQYAKTSTFRMLRLTNKP